MFITIHEGTGCIKDIKGHFPKGVSLYIWSVGQNQEGIHRSLIMSSLNFVMGPFEVWECNKPMKGTTQSWKIELQSKFSDHVQQGK